MFLTHALPKGHCWPARDERRGAHQDGEMFASLDFLSARDVEHLYSMQLIQDSPGQKLGLNWWRSSRQITRDPPRASSPISPDLDSAHTGFDPGRPVHAGRG